MALADKIWDGLTTVIKLNDKIERLAAAARTQQEKLEDMTARVVRLETALEIALSSRGPRRIERS